MNALLSRREFVQSTVGGVAVGLLPQGAGASDGPAGGAGGARLIIDTHTHFYDPTRPEGVPWPPKDNPTLYRPILPPYYLALPKPTPVAGTVVVEASGWVEDNQWILDLAAREPFIQGFVGNLPVGTAEFAGLLKRFATNPVFRGVRVQGARLNTGLGEPSFVSGLEALAERGLSLDVVGSPALLPEVVRLAREIPQLRIIIDHLAGVRIDGGQPPADWLRGMEAVARCANVWCKVSGLVEGSGKTGGQAPRELSYYRPVLDAIWGCFGEGRLIYGSNWPVCELFADLASVQRLASEFFETKGPAAAAKVFAGNAQRFYRLKEVRSE
jgi:predicted TIM-barrel fold metal-dependent hydrolase